MKILLVNPPVGENTIGLRHIAKVEPLSLEILGAAVPEHEVEILDMQWDKELEPVLERFQPDVVGVGAQVTQTYTSRHLLKTAKSFNPGTLTLLGGHHATLCPHEFNAPYIDAIILGEGVKAFQEVIERRRQRRSLEDVAGLALPGERGLRFTAVRPLPRNLDHHPLPNRRLTDKYRKRYFYLFHSPVASIQTSMGCTFPCNFCSCQKFSQRHFISHSPEYIVEDISRLKEDFVMFCDDHSFIDPNRMERLQALIKEKGIRKTYFAYSRADCVVQNPELFKRWAEVGLSLVMTGLEAIDDNNINAVNKKTSIETNEKAIEILRSCGVGMSAGFLVMPDYTEEDFKRIHAYVEKRPNIVLTELTPLTPFPGTDFHAEIKHKVLTENREVYDLAHFVVPTRLPARDLYGLIRKYYLKIVWRATLRLGLWKPRIILQKHMPRLIWGTLLNVLMLGRAHRLEPAPAED